MKKLATLEIKVLELKKDELVDYRSSSEEMIAIHVRIASAGRLPVEIQTDLIEKSDLAKLIGALDSLVILLKEEAKNQSY